MVTVKEVNLLVVFSYFFFYLNIDKIAYSEKFLNMNVYLLLASEAMILQRSMGSLHLLYFYIFILSI